MRKVTLLFFIFIMNLFSVSFGMSIKELEAKNRDLEKIIEGLDTMMASFYDSVSNFERHPNFEIQRTEILEQLQKQRQVITNLIIENKEALQTIRKYKKGQ